MENEYIGSIKGMDLECFCKNCHNRAVVRKTIIDGPLTIYACLCEGCASRNAHEISKRL